MDQKILDLEAVIVKLASPYAAKICNPFIHSTFFYD
jgi:hypothetical protein